MGMVATFVQLRRTVHERGVRGALEKLWKRGMAGATAPQPQHPFDRRNHVDTGGLIYSEDLATGHLHDVHSAGYYATAPSLFEGTLSLWRGTLAGTGLTLGDYALLDVGCGKGRVLMLASQHAFRRVVGVELHPDLALVARRNVRRWMRSPRACPRVEIIEGDILAVSFPSGPVLLYLFNSFERAMVELLLERLRTLSLTRTEPIDLIYVHPEFGDLVFRSPRVEMLVEEDVAFSAEDAEADAFKVGVDRCAIFRLPGLRT
jgi:SAM-dependent methyltransferase